MLNGKDYLEGKFVEGKLERDGKYIIVNCKGKEYLNGELIYKG